MLKAKKENAERKALERKNRENEHVATSYSIERNFAAARRKIAER
jgi:hypothetical protein